MINHVEDVVVYLSLKVFNFHISSIVSVTINLESTFIDNPTIESIQFDRKIIDSW